MAGANLSSQVVAIQLEQVEPKLTSLFALSRSNFAALFDKASEKHRISEWNVGGQLFGWRVPVKIGAGGDHQTFSLDGGDLGAGSMMATAYMTLPYYPRNTAFYIPALASFATASNKQAIANVLQTQIGGAIKEAQFYSEISLFGDGTGELAYGNGTGTPTGTNPTYNLTTNFGPDRLRGFNALVDVWDVTGTTKKGTGLRISNIDWVNITVTLTGTVTSPVNTDIITFPGMTGPLTNMSWQYGVYTFSSTQSSGSIANLPYSSAYELVSNMINGGGGFYTPLVALGMQTKLIQRRDDNAYKGCVGVCHMAQRAAYFLQGFAVSNWLRSGTSQDMIDLVPGKGGYSNTFVHEGITHYVSRFADKTRVDWISPRNFGQVMLDNPTFMQTPDGQRVFIGHSPTTGNPTAAFQFYIVQTDNLYNMDPGANTLFYNGGIPQYQ